MERLAPTSSLRKSYSNEPKRTLSFVIVDDDKEGQSEEPTTSIYVDKNKSKTEKSVHFADEESIADDASSLTNDSSLQSHSQASEDVITWLPSEHLYSDDTFIHDTENTTKELQSHDPTTSIPTVPSYGSNTFIQLDSDEDDTDTEQLYSYTDSFVSSEVFSTHSRSTTYKEWKDITEIVKDIEELEESEYVTRADSLEYDQKEGDDTEVSESLDEELAEEARHNFVTYALRQLRLKELQSPRSLAVDSVSSGHRILDSRLPEPKTKEERQFCLKLIRKCKKKLESQSSPYSDPACNHPLYTEVNKYKDLPVEYYGLNSALIERLKLSNLGHGLEKKSQDLDREIAKSRSFIKTVVEDEVIARDHFTAQMCARVRRENIEDAIQAHLIKMHPVTKFAEFVKNLPKPNEDAREILYEYKRQLEQRMAATDVT